MAFGAVWGFHAFGKDWIKVESSLACGIRQTFLLGNVEVLFVTALHANLFDGVVVSSRGTADAGLVRRDEVRAVWAHHALLGYGVVEGLVWTHNRVAILELREILRVRWAGLAFLGCVVPDHLSRALV